MYGVFPSANLIVLFFDVFMITEGPMQGSLSFLCASFVNTHYIHFSDDGGSSYSLFTKCTPSAFWESPGLPPPA